MSDDFLKELKFLGVTARLKRLSDTLSYSIKELYKVKGIDIEPSWHLVLLILKKNTTSTMTEIAEALQYSQPAITKMVTRMGKKGYIDIVKNELDSRKKDLTLSEKAKKELPKLEKIWDAGQKSIEEILESNHEFLTYLENFENQVNSKSFKDRVINKLEND